MKSIKFIMRLLLLIFFSATPTFACDPSVAWTVGLPVFALVLIIKIVMLPRNVFMKIILGLFTALAVLFLIGAGPFSLFIYIWVIYEILMLCMEFLFRSEKSLTEFYQNHKQRVWIAGSLLIGGVIAKIIYYSINGFSQFLYVYSLNFGYFVFWLIFSFALVFIMLICYGIKALLMRMRARRPL